jgi:uncharacterized protein YegL
MNSIRMKSSALIPCKPELVSDDGIDHVNNPHPRCPVAVLLDTSASMEGEPIAELEKAVRLFFEDVSRDPLASLRVDPSVFSFGGSVRQIVPFCTTMVEVAASPQRLEACGNTPLGEAVNKAIDAIHARVALYKEYSIPHYKPWLVLMSDGCPTDEWHGASARLRKLAENGWNVIAIGIGQNAELGILRQFGIHEPRRLQNADFASFFRWLSRSLRTESRKATSESSCPGMPAVLTSIQAP